MTNRRCPWRAGGRPAWIAALVLASIAGWNLSAPRPCRGAEEATAGARGDAAGAGAGGGAGGAGGGGAGARGGAAGAERGSSSRGRALFVGTEPLTAKIRGHQSNLPPEVVRCETCHGDGARTAAPNQGAPPRLDRSLLLRPLARRGGPPSSYDLASFCRMLRTGADPAYVLVARDMPTYDIDDAACAALWEFLTTAFESGGAPAMTRRGRATTKTGARPVAKTTDAGR